MQLYSTQYFGQKNLYQSIKKGQCCIEQHENYQKRSYRNRCPILTANGIEYLSIPLKSGKNKQKLITEVEISYDMNWMRQHIESIKSAYGSSAYLSYYLDEISEILYKKHPFLWELNLDCMRWLKGKLGIHQKPKYTQSYLKNHPQDFRKAPNPLTPYKSYAQVFEYKFDFEEHVSALDLLFCMGPESGNYL